MRSLFPFLQWIPAWRSPGTIRADAMAGLTGAMLVLPQGVAFASLAGLPPEHGLYAAMVPCIVAALFGSSRLMVTGPANAISLALLTLVTPLAQVGSAQYIALVTTLTFMVGAFMLLLGLARAGTLIAKIPESVILGFTAGAAVLIIASQVAPALGISRSSGITLASAVLNVWVRLDQVGLMPVLTATVTVAAVSLTRRCNLRGPAMLIGLAIGSLFAALAAQVHPSWHTSTGFQGTTAPFPPFSLPSFEATTLQSLLAAATTLTFLALAEATAIGRAIAIKGRERFNANQEILGQGLANLAGAFFSAYPSSGSFNRSTANVEAGARTPLSAVCAAGILMLLLAFLSELTGQIPIAAIAGVLLIVGCKLIGVQELKHTWQADPQARWPMSATFIGTLVFPLEGALLCGMLCAWAVKRLQSSARK
jgi:sulfate permease, SulP family